MIALNITLRSRPLAQITTLQAYAAELSSPIDSFLEDHILKSQFYAISLATRATDRAAGEARIVGHAALHERTLLTQFYVQPAVRSYSQTIFSTVMTVLKPKNAYVPTADECFLSHVLDLDRSAKLNLQAYFFVAQNPPSALRDVSGLHYRLAVLSDQLAIEALATDFINAVPHRIESRELHVGLIDDQIVALGIIERGRILCSTASIGMLTAPDFRQRGIGTHTIAYLRSICEAEALRPVAGCWYYNTHSKLTLEAAGMVSKTRLLRFEFGA